MPAINLFLSLILQKFSLCLREVGERNIIKFAGDRKSRIFKYMECSGNFAELEGHTLLDHFATPSGVSTDNSAW